MNAFKRDVALATWRQFMRRNSALTEDRLEELEVHLLDHMDQLQADGYGPDEAFRLASRRLGGYDEIEREYGKTKWGRTGRRDMLGRKLLAMRDMLATFLRSAVGSMRRHPGFTAINIIGFAVSLAAVLLISLYVHDELQFDAQHTEGERIFRMGGATTGWPYGQLVKDSHPEVEAVTYLRTYPQLSIRHEGVYTFPDQLYADAEFLRMFDFPLVEGDRETALRAPGSVVVTQELAAELFGTTDVLGRRLVMNDSLDMAITGIMPRPRRSHISFDMLISFETLRAQNPEWFDGQMTSGWLNLNVTNYVRLAEHASAAQLEEQIAGLPMEHAGDFLRSWGAEYALTLTPMTDIYLDAAAGNALGPSGSRALVRMLALVAAFLLLLALVNFVNLATARSTERAREVGIRKVAGSSRGLLVAQFMFEAILMTLLATILALIVAAVALPLLNTLSGKTLPWTDLLAPGWLAALAVGAVVAGMMSGLYPSVVLSRFAPVHVLKGRRGLPRAGGAVRRGLVVLQFTISSVMVLGTLLVHSQINFMLSASPGFDADEVMVVDTR